MNLFGEIVASRVREAFTKVATEKAMELQRRKHEEEAAELRRQIQELEVGAAASSSSSESSTTSLTQIGPESFIGPNIFELVKTVDTIGFRQFVAKIPCYYPTLGKVHPFQVSAQAGRVTMYIITASSEPVRDVPVLFYVPGTGLQVSNPEINNMIASQLRFAHNVNAQAVVINHRLCPDVFWPVPITDTVKIMRYFLMEYKPSSITIAGYSSGGLIAALAAIELRRHNYEISTLILQAPESDLTREFRNMDAENATDAHRTFLPQSYTGDLGRLKRDKQAAVHDQILKASTFDYYVREMYSVDPHPPLRELRAQSLLWRFNELQLALNNTHVVVATGIDDYFLPENNILIALLQQAGIKTSTIMMAEQHHGVFWQRLFSIYLCLAAANENEAKQVVLTEAEGDTFAEQEVSIQTHYQPPKSRGEVVDDQICKILRDNVISFFNRHTRSATQSNTHQPVIAHS